MPMLHPAGTTGAALAMALCAGMAAAQEVGPGPDPAPPAEAARIFAGVCAATLPDFRAAPAAIAALPLRQNPQTGTWYHRQLDLSVKLHRLNGENVCSVVFSSSGQQAAVSREMGAATAQAVGGRVRFNDGDGAVLAWAELPGRTIYELSANATPRTTMYRALMAVAP